MLSITCVVERCVDSSDWVWTLYCAGNELDYGYASTQDEAIEAARERREERAAELEGTVTE